MAIGLEIEIPVPIDQLTQAQFDDINTKLHQSQVGPLHLQNQRRAEAHIIRLTHGRVPYGIIQPAAGGFRIDADHDDRVKSNTIYREGGVDSIMELVVQPPVTNQAGLNAAMAAITAFVGQINAQTHNLTRRWVNALPGLGGLVPVSIGPLDWLPVPPAAEPSHNFDGSVQVNIGIDLREYHSMLRWYLNSTYSKPAAGMDAASVAIYQRIRDDIALAIEVGAKLSDPLLTALTQAERDSAGNGCGLRGWLTHLALYLRRGGIPIGQLGGSTKNVVPVLVKSPNRVLAKYGMTNQEKLTFNASAAALIPQLLAETGRTEHHAPGFNPATALVFPNVAGNTLTITELMDLTRNVVPLAGTAVPHGTGVGPRRTGNATVQALPTVPGGQIGGGANTRGGLVAEFRTLPNFHSGPAAWLAVGTDFLTAATTFNNRDGVSNS